MLTQLNYPFLKKEELETLTPEVAQAENQKRSLESKKVATKLFLDTAKDMSQMRAMQTANDTDQFNTYMRELKSTGLALDAFLYNRPDVRLELNQLRSQAPIGYGELAATVSDEEYTEYSTREKHIAKVRGLNTETRATVNSGDVPGVGNTLQTTVAQSIMHRIDNFDGVVSRVTTINQPYGNFDQPTYNKYGLAGYVSEGASIPDTTPNLNDNPNGINKVSFVAKEFAISFQRSWLAGKRISPTVIAQSLLLAEQEIGRGIAYQILSGPGTGLNDSGVTVVGTAATVGANIAETAQNAITSVTKANADRSKLVFFMNAEAWGQFVKIAMTSVAYQNVINVERQSIHGVPVVVVSTAVIPTAIGATKVVVGDFSHYINFTNGNLESISQTELNSATVNTIMNNVTAWLIARDGGVVFADSFAQFSVTIS